MKLTLYCCLCSAKSEHEFKMEDGWTHRYGGIDDERYSFCPEHAPVKDFTDSQCPGCVGGWGDCGLWTSFAYRKNTLTHQDYLSLENGICPKRVNGTIGVSDGVVEDIDLSERNVNAGKALAKAIREYSEKYQ